MNEVEMKARIAELEGQLVKESGRTAEYKLRADQMTSRLDMANQLGNDARDQLTAVQQGVQPFMHGIADGEGCAYFEEGCVAPDASDLKPEVDGLNSCLDEDEKPYSVVPLYTRPTPPEAVDTREAFERWAEVNYPIRRGFGKKNDYDFVEVRRMWSAWQAAFSAFAAQAKQGEQS